MTQKLNTCRKTNS